MSQGDVDRSIDVSASQDGDAAASTVRVATAGDCSPAPCGERIDWPLLEERTASSPYARAFFALLRELEVIGPAG